METVCGNVSDMDLSSFYTLKDSLEEAQQNTQTMLWRLQHFEQRLGVLDEKIRPIQRTTTTLSNAKRNIMLTSLEIEKTNEYFKLANENSIVIANGFKQESVEQFFEAIERITEAKRFFDDHREMKSAHAAMINIDNMIKRAMLHCVDEMNRLFRSCGKTFEEAKDGTFVVINAMTDANASWTKTICDCLEEHQVTSHLPMYLEQRTAIIKQSLKPFENASSTRPGSSSHNLSPAGLMQLIKEGNSLYTKGNLFFPRYMQATLTVLRGETLLFSSILPNPTPQAEKAFCSICMCVVQELLGTISDFVGADKSINNLVGSVSGSHSNLGGTGSLLANSFNMKKAEKSVEDKPVILQRKSNLFLIHLDILDSFLANFYDLRNLATPDDLKDKVLAVPISSLLDEQRSSIVRSCLLGLEHLLQAIRITNTTSAISSSNQQANQGSGATKAPVNTDLHPISGYVLCFCKEVVEFEAVYQAMLRVAEELDLKTDYLPASTISLESFMIDGLLSRLNEKTKGTVFHMHRNSSAIQLDDTNSSANASANVFDPAVRQEELNSAKIYLFLINNLDVVSSHLRGRVNVLQGTGSPGKSPGKARKSTYRNTLSGARQSSPDDSPLTVLTNQYNSVDNRIQIAVNELCSVISTILLVCINLDAAVTTAEGRAKRAFQMSQSLLDRQLKTCFGAFNDTIDLLISMKSQFRISSSDLRRRVQGQLQLELMDSYTEFFDKYSKVNFSKKNKESYLRYPPPEVKRVLDEFFS